MRYLCEISNGGPGLSTYGLLGLQDNDEEKGRFDHEGAISITDGTKYLEVSRWTWARRYWMVQ